MHRLGRHSLMVLAATLVVGAGLVLFVLTRPPEPVYQGKRASTWIEELALASAGNVAQIWALNTVGGTNRQVILSGPALGLPGGSIRFPTPLSSINVQTGNTRIISYTVTYKAGTNLVTTNVIALAALAGPGSPLNSSAVAAFKAMGPAVVPHLIRALKRKDSSNSRLYWSLYPRIPDRIKRFLPTPHPAAAEIRKAAAEALGALGMAARPAVPALKQALDDPEPAVRQSATQVLRRLAEKDEQVGAALADLLTPGLPPAKALQLVRDFSLRGGRVVETLMRLSKNGVLEDRRGAFALLEFMGGEASPAVPILTEALKDPDSEIRYLAVRTLANVGLAANSAVPMLKQALTDSNAMVRSAAARALMRLGQINPPQ